MPAKKTTPARKTPPAKKPASPKPATKPATPARKAAPKKPALARTDIFISYSQRDKAWMERLKTHLKPLERANLNVWVDTKLRAGDKWRGEIEKALAQTKVAILLISPNFLASDFIDSNELPPLLKAAAREGTTILPLLLSTSMFPMSPLSEFQAVNGPEHPLDLLSDGQVNQTLFQVAKRVHEIFNEKVSSLKKSVVSSASKPNRATKPVADQPLPKPKAPAAAPKALRREPAATPAKAVAARAASANHALLVRRNGDWEVVAVEHAKIGTQLALTLRTTSPAQAAFLATLRQSRDGLGSIVFGAHTYRCTLQELHAITENGRETWHLTADTQELGTRTELTYNSFTPDMQAQVRAELLLLNTQPTEQSTRWGLSSSGPLPDVSGSPFPILYQQLGGQPARFKVVAPLIITWYLQLTNTVQHILRLRLTLKGQTLTVDFEGRREPAHREEAATIRVQGTCALTGAIAAEKVVLGPLRNY